MTFEEYVTACYIAIRTDTGQRDGQFFSNFLFQVRPDLASAVPVECDPFYVNYRLPAFLDWVGNNW